MTPAAAMIRSTYVKCKMQAYRSLVIFFLQESLHLLLLAKIALKRDHSGALVLAGLLGSRQSLGVSTHQNKSYSLEMTDHSESLRFLRTQ